MSWHQGTKSLLLRLTVGHTCNSNAVTKARGLPGGQGYPGLCSELQVHLCYSVQPCLKHTKAQSKTISGW